MPKLISNEKIIPFLIMVLIISANPPWFLWGYNYYLVALSSCLILLSQINRLKKIKTNEIIFIFIYIISFMYFVLIKGYHELRISSIVFFITLLGCFLLNEKEKILSVDYFTKIYSAIIGISFSFWFMHNFIFEMPFKYDLVYGDFWGKAEHLTFNHYVFFIQPQMDYIRFYSVFDEPGVVGTLSAFILFCQKYNFKKIPNIIILIGSIFTYSLAFYLISLLGMLFIYIYEKRVKSIIGLFSFLFLSSSFMLSIDAFQLVIVNRFSEFSDALSRRNGVLSSQFYDNYIHTIDFIYGMPLNYLSINNHLIDGQSYKFFLIEYGLIGFFILILIYSYFVFKVRNIYVVVLLLLFIISFIQRPFLFTPWQIMVFVIMCSYLKSQRVVVRK